MTYSQTGDKVSLRDDDRRLHAIANDSWLCTGCEACARGTARGSINGLRS